MPGMPGMPGVGKRAGAKQKPQQKKKGKRVSGNPAKRAAEASGTAPKSDGASAFGFPAQGNDAFELPKELKDLL
jgi:signal recognition particle subunit SRP54